MMMKMNNENLERFKELYGQDKIERIEDLDIRENIIIRGIDLLDVLNELKYENDDDNYKEFVDFFTSLSEDNLCTFVTNFLYDLTEITTYEMLYDHISNLKTQMEHLREESENTKSNDELFDKACDYI